MNGLIEYDKPVRFFIYKNTIYTITNEES
jgi:hypothetical protein